MEAVNIDVRLRPIRFGFLARPEDKLSVETIFRINSCLWGGGFNPIIPFFKRVPAWWERKGIRFDNARQIVNGYLDFFEPDFLVEAEKGISEGYGVEAERVIQLHDVLPKAEGFRNRGFGLDVNSLYRKLYREEFQFVRRHKHNIADIKPADPAYSALVACLFGAFPSKRNLDHFAKNFQQAFDPQVIVLDGVELAKLYRLGWTSPLGIASAKLRIDYHDVHDPSLFILDARESRDLVDFWNYRAVHRNVLAIPVQWLESLSEFCRTLISKNYRPLPDNTHGIMMRTTLMFSRSIAENQIEPLYRKFLQPENVDAASLQTWYPPIWRASPDFVVRTTRPTIDAGSKTFQVSIDVENPTVRFDALHPEFSEQYGNKHRWANVIRLKDWSFKNRIATTFPTDFRRPAVPRFEAGLSEIISTTEGLVTFPRFKDHSSSWKLLDGSAAMRLWLTANGLQCGLSESGRAAEQIIQALGSFGGVRAIASKGIVELLNEMSRRPITRSAHRHEFQNKIDNAVGKSLWHSRTFELLVERRAVELGYELKCSKCGSWSWYSITQLSPSMSCELCLRNFEFPISDPTNSKHARWAYRVIGPFALPDYARGGYSTALAIRLIASVLTGMGGPDATWCAGQNLVLPGGERVELDFALWYQRKEMFGNDYSTDVVFGESKSFGKDSFGDKDIERLKLLSAAFPGAILVLATLKELHELSADEIKRIRRLAEWGREYDKDRRQSKAPVVVLTGTELFTPLYLQQKWKEKGGLHAKLIEPAYISSHIENLRILADLTQQIYLGMPSYGSWRRTRWENRQKARLRSVSRE